MEKRIATVSFEQFEPGGYVRFWTNPPSGVYRAFDNAIRSVEIPTVPKDGQPKDLEALKAFLDSSKNAREVEDRIWHNLLKMIDSWNLKGFEEEVLPVSMEGLDALPGEERTYLIEAMNVALLQVAKVDPRKGAPSEPTKPVESAPLEVQSNGHATPENSPTYQDAFTG